MKGIIRKSTGLWYRVMLDDGSLVNARLRGKIKLDDKKITNPIAVGDEVNLELLDGKDYVINTIENRKNYVIRLSPRKKGFHHLIAANVDQAILITSLRQPRTSIGFIDRFMVTLETFRIPGILVINKTDIYSEDELETVEAMKWMYEDIGYKTVSTSFESGDLGELPEILANKTSLLSGHSGTGKSTFINQLLPNTSQEVNDISDFSDKGVHTTTFAEMFTWKDAHIIDTPGIKELGLADIENEELSHFFPEMRELLGQCKFNNCIHINEPGCVIQAAVEEGAIHPTRFGSYLSMLQADDNRR